jgi:hypothetical protein
LASLDPTAIFLSRPDPGFSSANQGRWVSARIDPCHRRAGAWAADAQDKVGVLGFTPDGPEMLIIHSLKNPALKDRQGRCAPEFLACRDVTDAKGKARGIADRALMELGIVRPGPVLGEHCRPQARIILVCQNLIQPIEL